jgi:pimeloyl-ACP methyl ester carboxylesterase
VFRSVTLMASGPAAITGHPAEDISALAPVLDEGGLAAVFAARAALNAAEPGYVPPPADVAAFLHRRFMASSAHAVRRMGDAVLSEPDRVAELRQTGVPALVLYGDADDAWPPETQAEMAARLGAEVAVIPAAVHSPAAEQPEATAAALVSFWRSVG